MKIETREMMKKPERIIPVITLEDMIRDEVIDEYEKYNNWKMEQLPDEKELTIIIGKCMMDNMTSKMIAKIVTERIVATVERQSLTRDIPSQKMFGAGTPASDF